MNLLPNWKPFNEKTVPGNKGTSFFLKGNPRTSHKLMGIKRTFCKDLEGFLGNIKKSFEKVEVF